MPGNYQKNLFVFRYCKLGTVCSCYIAFDSGTLRLNYKDENKENGIAVFEIANKKIKDAEADKCKNVGTENKLHKACICPPNVKEPDSECSLDRKFEFLKFETWKEKVCFV